MTGTDPISRVRRVQDLVYDLEALVGEHRAIDIGICVVTICLELTALVDEVGVPDAQRKEIKRKRRLPHHVQERVQHDGGGGLDGREEGLQEMQLTESD